MLVSYLVLYKYNPKIFKAIMAIQYSFKMITLLHLIIIGFFILVFFPCFHMLFLILLDYLVKNFEP
jgi:hypothetical protein